MSSSYLPRLVEGRVRRLLEFFSGVLLTGPRGAGKTTLASRIAQDHASVLFNLENPADLELLKSNPIDVLLSHPGKLIIIDEVQMMPGLFSPIKVVIDSERQAGASHGKFLLISSVSGRLMRQTMRSLIGRVARVDMHGLNCIEAKPCGDLRKLWLRGGYPESLLAETESSSMKWRLRHVERQVGRELDASGSSLSADNTNATLKAIAMLDGRALNLGNFSKHLGTTRQDVSEYLEMLGNCMLVREVPSFFFRLGSHSVHWPRHYFCDSGLLHAARQVDEAQLLSGDQQSLRNASWHSFVINNLSSVMPSNWNIEFYRDHRGNGIDIVLPYFLDQVWAIAISSGSELSLTKRNLRALRALRPKRTFLVHGGTERMKIEGNAEAVPLEDMMNELMAVEHNNDFSFAGRKL